MRGGDCVNVADFFVWRDEVTEAVSSVGRSAGFCIVDVCDSRSSLSRYVYMWTRRGVGYCVRISDHQRADTGGMVSIVPPRWRRKSVWLAKLLSKLRRAACCRRPGICRGKGCRRRSLPPGDAFRARCAFPPGEVVTSLQTNNASGG